MNHFFKSAPHSHRAFENPTANLLYPGMYHFEACKINYLALLWDGSYFVPARTESDFCFLHINTAIFWKPRSCSAGPERGARVGRCFPCCGAAAAVPVLLQGLGNERTLRCPSACSSSRAGTRPNCLPRDGRGAGSKAQIPSVPSPAPLLSSSCCRLHAQHSHAQPRSRRSTASPLSEHYNPQQAPRQEAPLYHRP